jgi:hypothetical protein
MSRCGFLWLALSSFAVQSTCGFALSRGAAEVHPRDLAGDPSLILTTNVALTDKPGFVAAASAAVATALSKPEKFVAVCVTDSHEAMLFGGSS